MGKAQIQGTPGRISIDIARHSRLNKTLQLRQAQEFWNLRD